MRLIKLLGVSVVNTVVVLLTYIIVGNILCSIMRQYVDHFNISSILTFVVCAGLLAGATLLESKKLNLPLWAVLASSLLIIVVAGIGMAIAVAMIAGGIG